MSGLTHATAFAEIAGYHKAARDEIAPLVQVETLGAVYPIEATAAVPGVDGVFVGPANLAAALDRPGNRATPWSSKIRWTR